MGGDKPSVVDLLRARYEQIAVQPEQTFHKAVGHGVSDQADGRLGLLIEYREQDWLRTQEIQQKWARSNDPKWLVYAAAEQLASCCVDVWVRDDDKGQDVKGFKGKWSPGMGLGEGRVGFAKAAQVLGLSAKDGLEAVGVILVNDWEIKEHETALASWEPTPPEVGAEFLGESQAATG